MIDDVDDNEDDLGPTGLTEEDYAELRRQQRAREAVIDAALAGERLRAKTRKTNGGNGEGHSEDVAPTYSEEAMALGFAVRHAGHLRYIDEWKDWLSWTGTHWRPHRILHAFSLARQIARETAATCKHARERKSIAAAKTVAAIERLAKADKRLAAAGDQWDGSTLSAEHDGHQFIISTPTEGRTQ